MDPKRPTLRHIIIKMASLKERERTLKLKEKSRQLPTREHQLDWHVIAHQKHFRPEGSGVKYSR